VKVVNAPSEPVPVQGTVTPGTGTLWSVGVVGTPNVAVSNFPATTTVAFDGSANTVKIDTSNPLLVRDADNPARQVYANHRIIDLQDGEAAKAIFFSEVPAGKRLVIEEVSVNGYAPTGQIWQLATIGVDHFDTFDFDIEVKPRGPDPFSNGARDQFAGSQ